MGWSTKRRSPFESPAGALLGRRRTIRTVRNLLLVVAACTICFHWAGEPLLRWEYRYRGRHSDPVMIDATYVGFSGRREIRADDYAEGCPLILFVKPEPSLSHKLLRALWPVASSPRTSQP